MLTELHERHETLGTEREILQENVRKIDEQMVQIRAAVGNLAALHDPLPAFKGQMADAIRAILALMRGMSTAKEIREDLLAIGYDLEKHSNPLATIHGVLKRLTENSGVGMERDEDGSTRYFWGAADPSSDEVSHWLADDSAGSESSASLSPGALVVLRRRAILDARGKAI